MSGRVMYGEPVPDFPADMFSSRRLAKDGCFNIEFADGLDVGRIRREVRSLWQQRPSSRMQQKYCFLVQ